MSSIGSLIEILVTLKSERLKHVRIWSITNRQPEVDRYRLEDFDEKLAVFVRHLWRILTIVKNFGSIICVCPFINVIFWREEIKNYNYKNGISFHVKGDSWQTTLPLKEERKEILDSNINDGYTPYKVFTAMPPKKMPVFKEFIINFNKETANSWPYNIPIYFPIEFWYLCAHTFSSPSLEWRLILILMRRMLPICNFLE